MQQRGFTLIEVLIAMVVTVGLIATLVLVAKDAHNDARQAQLMAELQQLADTAHLAYSASSDPRYGSFSQKDLVPHLTPPISTFGDGTELRNPYGGSYELNATHWGSEAKRALQILVSEIPRSQCVVLLNAVADQFDAVALDNESAFIKKAPDVRLTGQDLSDACTASAAPNFLLYVQVL